MKQGGTLYVENNYTDVIIYNSNIINTTAREATGGFATITDSLWFNVTRTTVIHSES